ncbi:MAG TPA: hypothetical protein VF723_12340 [Pyrinomonadaceae bacterium]|jgi:hypothetical protein
MKAKLLFLTLLVALFAAGCGRSWQTLNENGFSVNMPGKASKNEQNVASAAGPITIHLYTLENKGEGFIVGYSEYPPAVFDAASSDKLLDAARQGAIANVQGQVTNERKINLGDIPGREITGNSPSQNVSFTARVYLAKPRMYMLVYSAQPKDKPISADGTKFLDSFKLSSQ